MKKTINKTKQKITPDGGCQKPRILLVEDDELIARACESGLKKAGYAVDVIRDGATAAKSIKQELPDLVLLDLMLPRMSGEQVLKTMNDNGLIKKIPVIILSAKGDNASIGNCLRMGASDYLVKANFSMAEVIEKVKKCFYGK